MDFDPALAADVSVSINPYVAAKSLFIDPAYPRLRARIERPRLPSRLESGEESEIMARSESDSKPDCGTA